MQNSNNMSSLKIIGIGGAGATMASAMYSKGIPKAAFVAIDKATPAFAANPCPCKVVLEQRIIDSTDDLIDVICDAQTVILVAGMGGETATDALWVVAEMAKDMDIYVVCVVTLPFAYEGGARITKAKAGIKSLKKLAKNVIVFDNQALFNEMPKNLTMAAAFDRITETIYDIVCDIAVLADCSGGDMDKEELSDIRKSIKEYPYPNGVTIKG